MRISKYKTALSLAGGLACAALVAGVGGRAAADQFLGGFENTLASPVGGASWELYDADEGQPGDQPWASSFVTEGATEGTMALQIMHPADAWQHGMRLNTGALAPLVAANDKLEFDVFTSPDATWRAVWVIMQGDGMNWTQASQVDTIPGQSVHAVIDMSNITRVDPNLATPVSWKTGAAASPGVWWQVLFAIMGGDGAQPITYTTIDNIKFTAVAPSADFDPADGDVDGEDFNTWKAGFGTGTGGDANGDGRVDGRDFLVWQAQFTGPNPGIASIPEPGAALLAAAAMAALVGKARGKRRG